jgi:DNA-binding response OmpR family regulator
MMIYIMLDRELAPLKEALTQIPDLASCQFIYFEEAVASIVPKLYITKRRQNVEYKQLVLGEDIELPMRLFHLAALVAAASHSRNITVDAYTLIPHRRLIIYKEQELRLTEKEAELLRSVMQRYPNPLMTSDALREVWSYAEETESTTLSSHVNRLRQKFLEQGWDENLLTVQNKALRFLP